MLLKRYSQTVNASKPRTFVRILISIVTASSTTNTIKLNRFAPLVLVQWSQPLSKLTVELKSQERSGSGTMSLKFWLIVVLISMG
jgi:hypothetical protein